MTKYGAIALLVIAPLSSSAFLPELSLRNGCSASRRRPADRAFVAALDADTLRDCAIYDAAMDAELRDLKARVQSAEFNAEQQRGLVEMAQKTLWEQNNLTRTLKAQVASLEAELEAASGAAAAGGGLEAELQAARAELESVRAELQMATTGAASLVGELASETRKKVMHHEKAKEFFAQVAAARKEAAASAALFASLQAELRGVPELDALMATLPELRSLMQLQPTAGTDAPAKSQPAPDAAALAEMVTAIGGAAPAPAPAAPAAPAEKFTEASLTAMKVPQLKELCQQRGMPIKGLKKAELVWSLLSHPTRS